MNPIFGLIALFALIGCSRRGGSASEKEGACGEDSEVYSITSEQEKIQVCHKDGNKDAAYQKDSDRLTVKVQDRFISAEDKGFPNFQQKYHLPNFQGLHLKKWSEAYGRTFPKGALGKEGERFRSLQNFLQEKNLSTDEILSTAQHVPWLNEESRPSSWKEIGSEEKMDALSLVALLTVIQKERGGFYQANKDFIDTTLRKISSGRLSLQKQTKMKEKKLNDRTEIWGRDRSAGYHRGKNLLLLGLPLDPSSLVDSSNYIHELYHFYQDATRLKSNFLEVEFSAYVKQGEYVLEALKTAPFRERYLGAEDYLQKEYFQSYKSLERPAVSGILYAQARLDPKPGLEEKARENLEELIHRYYYFPEEMKKIVLEPAKKAAQVATLILTPVFADTTEERNPFEAIPGSHGEPGKVPSEPLLDPFEQDLPDKPASPAPSSAPAPPTTVDIALDQLGKEIRKADDQKAAAIKQLEASLEAAKQENTGELSNARMEELVRRFREVLQVSTYLNELSGYKMQLAWDGGEIKPITKINVDLFGKNYLDLYRELAKYQPLKLQSDRFDGVD